MDKLGSQYEPNYQNCSQGMCLCAVSLCFISMFIALLNFFNLNGLFFLYDNFFTDLPYIFISGGFVYKTWLHLEGLFPWCFSALVAICGGLFLCKFSSLQYAVI